MRSITGRQGKAALIVTAMIIASGCQLTLVCSNVADGDVTAASKDMFIGDWLLVELGGRPIREPFTEYSVTSNSGKLWIRSERVKREVRLSRVGERLLAFVGEEGQGWRLAEVQSVGDPAQTVTLVSPDVYAVMQDVEAGAIPGEIKIVSGASRIVNVFTSARELYSYLVSHSFEPSPMAVFKRKTPPPAGVTPTGHGR